MASILFCSGSENWVHYNCLLDAGINHMLMSYYYFKKHRSAFEKRIGNDGVTYLIDSGGFSLNKQENLTKDECEKHFKGYLKFIQKYKDNIYGAVELDVEDIVGLKRVEEWREQIIDTGVPLIVIWHPKRGYNYWVETCDKYDYVGLTSETVPGMKFKKMFNVAKKHKVGVHGFAMTKLDYMLKYPFKSMDSTTWKSGEMWGSTLIFQNRSLTTLANTQKTRRKKYKNFCKKLGIDFKKLIKDDPYTVNRFNLKQLHDYLEYINTKKFPNNYWEEENEETKIESTDKGKGEIIEKKRIRGRPLKKEVEAEKERALALAKNPLDYTIEAIINPKNRSSALVRDARENLKGNMNAMKTGMFSKQISVMCEKCVLGGERENFNDYADYLEGKFEGDPKDIKDIPDCQLWLPGSVCAYNKLTKYNVRDVFDLQYALQDIVSIQSARVNLARIQELTLNEGVLDPDVSREMQRLYDMTKDLIRVKDLQAAPTEGDELTAKGKGVSILQKFFGVDGDDSVEAKYEIVEEEKEENESENERVETETKRKTQK